jgi:hypothetical protein
LIKSFGSTPGMALRMRGMESSNIPAVMRGLDPRIQLVSEEDGLPGQARQ